MSGYVPCQADWWPEIAADLQGSGEPWSEAAVMMDLRWWADQVACGKVKRMPSRADLCDRWNRHDGYAIRRIMANEAAWRDTFAPENVPGQKPARNRPAATRSNADNRTKTARNQPETSHTREPLSSQPQPHSELADAEAPAGGPDHEPDDDHSDPGRAHPPRAAHGAEARPESEASPDPRRPGGRRPRGAAKSGPARKPTAPVDPRARRVTDAWSAAWLEERGVKYPWPKGDRAWHRSAALALQVVEVLGLPAVDGADRWTALQASMTRAIQTRFRQAERGLTDDPTFDWYAARPLGWQPGPEEAERPGYRLADPDEWKRDPAIVGDLP